MHAIEHTYVSLLADVAHQSGFSEIRGSYLGLQWVLKEAPKLEKYVLDCIESNRKIELDIFPDGLRRLAAASIFDAYKLRHLRQLLLFCYKASVTHDKETTEKAYQDFLDTNFAVGRFGSDLSRVSPALLNSARRHCQSVLFGFNGKEIIPSHGPGAVTNSKEKWQNRYDTIERLYPYSDYFCLSQNRDHLEYWDEASDNDHITARLVAVPKDMRGPRLICVHPAEAIWIQQGLRRELERVISRRRTSYGPWPFGRIRFDDQSVNGKIALCSSLSRRYATIDMKEASDRIAEPLVQILFGSNYKYFASCRAQKVRIPKLGSLQNLVTDIYSYAPMGNATTFPVQSLVFWAICVASLQRQGFHQPGAVFVFGDDIIVPSESVEGVISDLESFGLLVNRTKSFWRGAFRESCGVDAFNGVNVTPVRWKTTLDAEHVSDLQSLSDIAMRLRIAGYSEAAASAYRTLRYRLKRRYGRDLFFTNDRNHGGVAEYTTTESYVWKDASWHPNWQRFCSRVWRLEDLEDFSSDHDWNHVLKSLTSLELQNSNYFKRTRSIESGRVSRRVRLNRGWTPIR